MKTECPNSFEVQNEITEANITGTQIKATDLRYLDQMPVVKRACKGPCIVLSPLNDDDNHTKYNNLINSAVEKPLVGRFFKYGPKRASNLTVSEAVKTAVEGKK